MYHDASAAGITAMMAAIVTYGIVLLAFFAFTILLYWRIFAKAGYNGALALLNVVPGFGQLICMVILAFGRWPLEDQAAAAYGHPVSPTVPPTTPGSSVMPLS